MRILDKLRDEDREVLLLRTIPPFLSVLFVILLAILLIVLPFVSDGLSYINNLVLGITAVTVLCYTYLTYKLYQTTFDSNRISSFSGLLVDKGAVEKENVIKIANKTRNSVLNVYIVSFLIDSKCQGKDILLYEEIQPFIHPDQPIVQSDILREPFRSGLLKKNFESFEKENGYHLVIGLLTPLMKKRKEAMVFYFENKDANLLNLRFEHRHHSNETKIHKSCFDFIWDAYKEYKKAGRSGAKKKHGRS